MPKAAQYEATATSMSREAATVLEPLTKLACASSLTPEVQSSGGETMSGAWALALMLLNTASALAILPADENMTGSIRGMQLCSSSVPRKLAGRAGDRECAEWHAYARQPNKASTSSTYKAAYDSRLLGRCQATAAGHDSSHINTSLRL